MRIELARLFRTIRLRQHFGTTKNITTSTFKPRSNFFPSTDHIGLRVFEKTVCEELCHTFTKNKGTHSTNFSNSEWNTLRSLANDKNLIWKPADKGGAIVLMNHTDYMNEIHRQLSIREHYLSIERDPTHHIQSIIKTVTMEGLSLGYISEDVYKYLHTPWPRTPVLYILPKIHKNIRPVPGRPIISGSGSILEPLAKFVDHHLQPFVKQTSSYVRDTKHFINIIEPLVIPTDAVLMSIDVTSLYTSIPIEEARTICESTLNRRSNCHPPTFFLLDLLDIILEKNFFKFDQKYYFQIQGVAMGSPVAPSIANLFMDNLENNIILNRAYNPVAGSIIKYCRFIDDIFIIINSHHEAETLLSWINTVHHNIKFTGNISATSLVFLDVMIIKENDRLRVRNHRKTTDRNSLLHYNSYHHWALKNNLPFSQMLRIKRNSSTQQDFTHEIEVTKRQFRNRGYPEHIIQSSYLKVANIPRSKLLENKTRPRVERLIWPLTLTNMSNLAIRTIKKYWNLIRDIPGCERPPLIAYKRTKSIGDFLVHSDLTHNVRTMKSNLIGNYRCHHCSVCNQLVETKIFTHQHPPFTIKFSHFATCITKGVIYGIICECKLMYVGQTRREVKSRIIEHRSKIRTNSRDSILYKHFDDLRHNPESFKYHILEVVTQSKHMDFNTKLLQRETYWIFRLRTEHPYGLNEHNSYSCYI
nr:uncharacterized protein LOC132761116 [Anolis sagrei ordinatus]XP_060609686.1 uncharacterized protein LOC132761116 [Anolis sagrei ordinatus]XP_060610145.1 uncharacterized protein LOC132761359 [Anolis sagrei ordinatus]XP_060610146.1 uncharacterized protein LOC132761359 [Anolis sagrei ordinatus]XP_060610703.1 uncharacterized protein LOC132761651 [Anolis sagrei ordinatus]XP_060610704.1 uncharacterized protein LOC132761651 [Anolis sagrei ordinatus]XP_060615565.1 uncharacterized protein LOC13276